MSQSVSCDLVLVAVRRDQLLGTLPLLAAVDADVMFFGNAVSLTETLAGALGERALFGFPGAGGVTCSRGGWRPTRGYWPPWCAPPARRFARCALSATWRSRATCARCICECPNASRCVTGAPPSPAREVSSGSPHTRAAPDEMISLGAALRAAVAATGRRAPDLETLLAAAQRDVAVSPAWWPCTAPIHTRAGPGARTAGAK